MLRCFNARFAEAAQRAALESEICFPIACSLRPVRDVHSFGIDGVGLSANALFGCETV